MSSRVCPCSALTRRNLCHWKGINKRNTSPSTRAKKCNYHTTQLSPRRLEIRWCLIFYPKYHLRRSSRFSVERNTVEANSESLANDNINRSEGPSSVIDQDMVLRWLLLMHPAAPWQGLIGRLILRPFTHLTGLSSGVF